MSEPVVDALELVQVEEQQPHLLVLSRGLSGRLCEPVDQQAPIGQPGEPVMIGKAAHPRSVSPHSKQLLREPRIAASKHLDLLPCLLILLSRSRDAFAVRNVVLRNRSS